MIYDDTVKHAASLARHAFTLMRNEQIPVTPVNYHIWYDHVSGRNMNLTKSLETVLQSESSFDYQRSIDLYERHIRDREEEDLSQVQEETIRILDDAVGHIADVKDDAAAYCSELCENTKKMIKRSNDDELNLVVNDLVGETKRMIQSTSELTGRLANMARELEQVKKDFDAARSDATTDALTGLGNRRVFDEYIETYSQSRDGDDLYLLMADIDHFKRVNDTHGHIVGDQVLRCVASIINSSIGTESVATRYGGEEFAILIKETTENNVNRIAEKIRHAISAAKLTPKCTGMSIGAITVSLGISIWCDGDDSDTFVERADKALYRAKHFGRNRIESIVAA